MRYANAYDRDRYRARTAGRPRYGRAPFKRAHRKPSPLQMLGAAALAVGLASACWFAVTALSGLASGAPEESASGSPLSSTPRDSWKAGEIPVLYQGDPAWAHARYAEGDFAETGCGPTCMAMVYVALTGRDDRGPSDMGALSERLGCASADGTAWTFLTEGAAELGLAAEELPADEGAVRRAILAGSPVVCSMAPGDFTTTGHFIVLAGIDANGRLIVRDPNSPERTARTWSFDTVLGQSRAIWAYSLA